MTGVERVGADTTSPSVNRAALDRANPEGEIGARYGAEIDPWARELAEETVARAADLDSRITASRKLSFFAYGHLPEHLQEVSRPFCELAEKVAAEQTGAEATVCLRKLLEAKDCAVRAALAPKPVSA